MSREIRKMLSKWEPIPGLLGDRHIRATRLYRYMPLQYAKNMVDSGIVRVAASTNYRTETSKSRRDEEETKSKRVLGAELFGTPAHLPEGYRVSTEIEAEGANHNKLTMTGTVPPYWLLALTTDLTPAMFDRFENDAAVEISDPIEFLCRMHAGSTELHGDGANIDAGFVEYVGELIAYGYCGITYPAHFHKNVEFKAQKEFRLVWAPKQCNGDRQGDGDYFTFQLAGGLRDIARVIRKRDVVSGREPTIRFPEDIVENYQRRQDKHEGLHKQAIEQGKAALALHEKRVGAVPSTTGVLRIAWIEARYGIRQLSEDYLQRWDQWANEVDLSHTHDVMAFAPGQTCATQFLEMRLVWVGGHVQVFSVTDPFDQAQIWTILAANPIALFEWENERRGKYTGPNGMVFYAG